MHLLTLNEDFISTDRPLLEKNYNLTQGLKSLIRASLRKSFPYGSVSFLSCSFPKTIGHPQNSKAVSLNINS